MKICYFGDFDISYPRSRVFIKGLRKNNIDIIICNDRTNSAKKYFNLLKKFLSTKEDFDLVIVGYSNSRLLVPLIRPFTRKPVIWDAFYSVYNNLVFNRKLVNRYNPKALMYWFLDWLSCFLSDFVVLDTDAHIEYFIKTFHIPRKKFLRIFVGTDNDIFYPGDSDKNDFVVHFHGKFIPHQGVKYIVEAISYLRNENITFQIIGQGQQYQEIKKKASSLNLSNIIWVDRVDYDTLPKYINKAEICLGGFGGEDQSLMASMNKLFEYMACGKAIITADTPASREFLQDGKSAVFCHKEDGKDLANKILFLKNNSQLRKNLGVNARKDFETKYNPQILIKGLMAKLKTL